MTLTFFLRTVAGASFVQHGDLMKLKNRCDELSEFHGIDACNSNGAIHATVRDSAIKNSRLIEESLDVSNELSRFVSYFIIYFQVVGRST